MKEIDPHEVMRVKFLKRNKSNVPEYLSKDYPKSAKEAVLLLEKRFRGPVHDNEIDRID